MKTKVLEKLKNWWSVNRIFQILAFALFCIYLAQEYVRYDIDKYQVLPGYMTLIIFALRWTTIVTVGFAVIIPFFGGKAFKAIFNVLGIIVPIANLALYEENMTAWGTSDNAYVPWRATLFNIEQVLIFIIAVYELITYIKYKEYKGVKYYRIPLILAGMYFTFAYQPLFSILFGECKDGTEYIKTLDFNLPHIIFLLVNPVMIIGSYILMHKKNIQEKNLFFAALSCSGVFNFFYIGFGGYGSLPLHLCNFAIIMMFMAFIFKMKGVFYFTFFVNVLGALFAMLMPNVQTDVYALDSMRFWYNHIYAFSLPIMGIALEVYERPNLKMMFKAIGWFTFYFVLVIFFNSWFTALGADVDYFFINSNFLFDKLNMSSALKDNYVYQYVTQDGLIFTFYPLFYFCVYIVFVGLMFVMWYIYDAMFHVADAHIALHDKKKIMKEGYEDLRKLLNGRSLKDPLYKEYENMIEIKNFTKTYAGSSKPSVDNLTLTVPNGTIYGFLGHNGAGKSTTIKSIVGIQSITSGQIIVDGFDVEKQPVESKLRIGYVSDNHAVYEKLTGREYINYIADLYMVSKEDRDERIKKYTHMFRLEDAIDREIKSYSHGMKQKIVVIASLIHDPKVWILDEPLTGLDPTSAFEIKECMKDHAKRGNIVFFSSHVIEVVEKICDRICIINHGHLQCEYSMEELHEKGLSLEELYMKYVSSEEHIR